MSSVDLLESDVPDAPTSGVRLVADEFPDFPWDRERLYRLRVWTAYERGSRTGPSATPTYEGDHVVDEKAVDEWANEVLAELRAGRSLVDAIDMANREEE